MKQLVNSLQLVSWAH